MYYYVEFVLVFLLNKNQYGLWSNVVLLTIFQKEIK